MSHSSARTFRQAILTLIPAAFLLGACVPLPGTVATAVGTGTVIEQKSKYEHQHEVERAVDAYIADHADSPCTNGEDEVVGAAVEILKRHRLTGYDEVMDRLNDIYADESQADNVRAAALYNMAVLNSRKLEPNRAQAREYFKRLYMEYPDEYRCIFAESEWRDSMIEQQLLMPGETVESFLEDARKDVESRSQKVQE